MTAPPDDLASPRGTLGRPSANPDAFGPAAEAFARFFGTPTYLLWQTAVVIVWLLLNAFAWALQWDKYPFILLNLMFSTQAAYAAPLILLAQNRQADRDKAETERDRERNARGLADMEFLAREIAAVRLSLEQKVDREDLLEPLDRLARQLERLGLAEVESSADDRAGSGSDG